jgi:hypothetical protein
MVVFGMIDDDVAGGSSFIIDPLHWLVYFFWNEKEPLRRASAARPHAALVWNWYESPTYERCSRHPEKEACCSQFLVVELMLLPALCCMVQ